MRTRAGRARQARQAGALFSKLPDDVQLAVLARVPYSDLHGGVAAACKAWSTIVASKPFRETRAAAGCDEFGLLVSLWGARALVEPRVDTPMQCFLVTAAGARRALPPPSGTENFFTVALGQDVYFYGHNRIGEYVGDHWTSDLDAFDLRRDTWRRLTPLVRADDEDEDGMGYIIERAPAVASVSAGKIFVVGGELATYGLDSRRRVDAYDPATDTWSQLEDRPTLDRWENGVEVNGKLYFYNNDEDPESIGIFDPETQAWTALRLPHVLDEQNVDPRNITGFERHGCFVVMARFRLGSTPESVEYKAVLYDPSTDAWSEAPFPAAPVQAYRCTHIDGTLFAWGSQGPEERGVGTEGGLWGRENSRIVMLRPGSTTWVDVPMPPDLRCLATRLAAVRLG